jgi:hypothetical protein
MLSSPPEEILDETNLTLKVTSMTGWLQKYDIDSLGKLQKFWKETNPYYLQESLLLWFNAKHHHAKVKEIWNQLIKK